MGGNHSRTYKHSKNTSLNPLYIGNLLKTTQKVEKSKNNSSMNVGSPDRLKGKLNTGAKQMKIYNDSLDITQGTNTYRNEENNQATISKLKQ